MANFADKLFALFDSPPAKANRFVMEIVPPEGLQLPQKGIICLSVGMPSYTFSSMDVNRGTMLPMNPVSNIDRSSVSVQFLLTESLAVKKFFEDWQQKIFVPATIFYPDHFNFYEKYIGELSIHQTTYADPLGESLDNRGPGVKLTGAYPLTVEPIAYAHSSTSFQTLTVQFNWDRIIPI